MIGSQDFECLNYAALCDSDWTASSDIHLNMKRSVRNAYVSDKTAVLKMLFLKSEWRPSPLSVPTSNDLQVQFQLTHSYISQYYHASTSGIGKGIILINFPN